MSIPANLSGLASEETLREVRDALAGGAPNSPDLVEEEVNVQEYRRPDGSTKRIVESTIVDGEVVRTLTTTYEPVIEEAD